MTVDSNFPFLISLNRMFPSRTFSFRLNIASDGIVEPKDAKDVDVTSCCGSLSLK